MVTFLRALPSATVGTIEIAVTESRPQNVRAHCAAWAKKVHWPYIAGVASRSDRDWGPDWHFRIPGAFLAGRTLRRSRMFRLVSVHTRSPIGIILLLESERWVADQNRPAVFVWYCSGAPDAYLTYHGHPKMVHRAVLDIAVTVSLNGPADGQLWLHAEPKGGQALLDWYAGRGLLPLAASLDLPQPIIGSRVNDGRYFCLDATAARRYSASLDSWR